MNCKTLLYDFGDGHAGAQAAEGILKNNLHFFAQRPHLALIVMVNGRLVKYNTTIAVNQP